MTEERMVPLDVVGKLYTMRDWIDKVETGQLTDRDGWGFYSNGEEYLIGRPIYPSLLQRSLIDGQWSHVLWFNFG